jgi:hypothetical protein
MEYLAGTTRRERDVLKHEVRKENQLDKMARKLTRRSETSPVRRGKTAAKAERQRRLWEWVISEEATPETAAPRREEGGATREAEVTVTAVPHRKEKSRALATVLAAKAEAKRKTKARRAAAEAAV